MAKDLSADDEARFGALLREAADGDVEARQKLWSDHYDMLRDCAHDWMRRNWHRRGNDFAISLGGTDIVNAAYERMHDRAQAMANGKSYFFRAFYTECMRIVVDHYRKTKRDKGRGEMQRAELQSQFLSDNRMNVDFERIHEILDRLERQDARVGQVAMLKVFENRPDEKKPASMRGLTNGEVAELLGIGLRTVEQDWAFAKAWLMKELGGPGRSTASASD